MEPLRTFVETFFAVTDRWQGYLSKRWREHANRRTILISMLLGAVALALYVFIIEPPETFPTDELVSVPAGATVTQVGKILQEEGVVRNATAFRILAEALGGQRGVRAGDYLFKQPENIFTIARAMVAGQFGLEPARFRIPEGATAKLMADVYASQLQRFDAQDFLAKAAPLEGYLFPDTYFFLPNATQDTVLETMRQNFDAHLQATTTSGRTLAQDVAASGRSLQDIVIMASIIEREAPGDVDRRLIAGVLWNRIKLGMPLQTDVPLTFLTGKNDSALTVKDLASTTPYNTYTHKGLPPGAIGNPSFDSIVAAANPTKSDYLYFLADPSGVTHYAKTYAQQVVNERKYLGR